MTVNINIRYQVYPNVTPKPGKTVSIKTSEMADIHRSADTREIPFVQALSEWLEAHPPFPKEDWGLFMSFFDSSYGEQLNAYYGFPKEVPADGNMPVNGPDSESGSNVALQSDVEGQKRSTRKSNRVSD